MAGERNRALCVKNPLSWSRLAAESRLPIKAFNERRWRCLRVRAMSHVPVMYAMVSNGEVVVVVCD